MTAFISAIHVRISWLAALVTGSNNFISDALAQPVIKHKVFPVELIFQTLLFYLLRIVDDTPFEVIHIFETRMQHKSAGLFATDAAGAVHDNVFILFVLQD